MVTAMLTVDGLSVATHDSAVAAQCDLYGVVSEAMQAGGEVIEDKGLDGMTILMPNGEQHTYAVVARDYTHATEVAHGDTAAYTAMLAGFEISKVGANIDNCVYLTPNYSAYMVDNGRVLFVVHKVATDLYRVYPSVAEYYKARDARFNYDPETGRFS